ncbi:SDR family NAD(P)-dependent oxidoreductase [Halomicrococcus sp. NG-SE-24]|uniref:SDR family NAD(P)-dependent oxidoreductase n=1 Tax=Halomicrococcus sp. NG-SE-24 TaxID=3436928 RepID=UPI003D956875
MDPTITERQNRTVVLLTGGTSGIGRAAARQLAARGVAVLITGRRRAKGEAALDEIQDAHPSGEGAFYRVDFANQDDVHRLARDVKTDYDRLDVLVNNAGTGQAEKNLTDDGLELTFAVNYVAPFLLSNLLVPRLRESTPARVLSTVTVAQHDHAYDMGEADLSDFDAVANGASFNLEQAYVNSKLALLLFTYELADRLAGTGVTAASVNPGLIGTTDITRDAPLGGTKVSHWIAALVARIAPLGPIETEETAGELLVHHALEQELPDGTGTYFDRWERADPDPRAEDRTLREQLWADTAALTGLSESKMSE